jgi:cytochrome c553
MRSPMADDNDDDRPRELIHFTRLQRLAIATGIVVGCLLIGGAVFIWSGYYNVAATREHWDVTTRLLETVRDQSIAARAEGIPVPELDDEDLILLGAEHFRTGCAVCHGTPGEENNPIFTGMLPAPPDLAYASHGYDSQELFWIVTHGLKYTGMPPWPSEAREDEVWALVAFIEHLNDQGAEVYPRLVSDLPTPAGELGEELTGVTATALENCVRCHGAEGVPPISNLVPTLHGQSAAYLTRAIHEYQELVRASGYMTPVAHEMTEAETEALVGYYAGLEPIVRSVNSDPATLARGEQIATQGIPQAGVPACLSCHSGRASPQFPLLAGQSARYIEVQFQVWRDGLRDRTGYGAIMAQIARRLTEEQSRDVAAWFEAQTRSGSESGSASP